MGVSGLGAWAGSDRRPNLIVLLALGGKPQELFDIEAGPFEKNNLIDAHPEIVRELTNQLKAWPAEPRLSPHGD